MLATSESVSGVGLPRILDLHAGRRQIQLNAMASTLQLDQQIWTTGIAKTAFPGIPVGNLWDTRGIPKRATSWRRTLSRTEKIAGESRSGTPNQTRHNTGKLLWRTLSHGNSLGPAHEVEPRRRRAMTSWPRYITADLYGMGGARQGKQQRKHGKTKRKSKQWMRSKQTTNTH